MGVQIKVSVIIPVYNVERYLADCLDSVLAQTMKELEIICVDDGATDSSSHILEKYEKKDSRVKVIHQVNAGAGAARNRGVTLARGEYIGFVDSDDIVYPTMYEELYRKAASSQADMAITGEVETAVGTPIRFPLENYEWNSKVLELDTFNAVEQPDIVKNVFLWNRIYRRAFWLEHNLQIPEGRRFAEDLLICTQTAVLAKKIAYVRGPLYWYRNERENSLSDTLAKSSNKLDYVVAVRESKEFLKETGLYSIFQNNFLEFCLHLFSMLQCKITNYGHFCEFYSGMKGLLDQDDMDVLERTWLADTYPHVLHTLRKKHFLTRFLKNRICTILHAG